MTATQRGLFTAALMALVSPTAHAQSFGSVARGAERPPEQERQRQEQRREDRRVNDGNSRGGRQFDRDVQDNSGLFGQPRRQPNGYGFNQSFNPSDIYFETELPNRPLNCPINTFGVANPGYMAAFALGDVSCRPIMSVSGSRNRITIYEYGYQGYGRPREYKLWLTNLNVTAVTVDGAQLPPQVGELILDREAAGIPMTRYNKGGQYAERHTLRDWAFTPR